MAEESGLGDLISSLLGNKEVMEAVSSAQKHEMPTEGTGTRSELSLSPELLAALPKVMGAISKTGLLSPEKPSPKKEGNEQSSKKALLYALKPFLSEKRRALIDTLIQLEGVLSLLGTRQEHQQSKTDI
ncbi:MAG: hypothetical protein IKL24_01590 [Clostridia bacterium]|nr:hypothetical protein [Clostridia bacterium]